MKVKVLAIGDIVGKPGREMVKTWVKKIRKEHKFDLIIANAENAAGGLGLTPDVAQTLLDSGVDVLTGGDHIWGKKEIIPYFEICDRLLRPANYNEFNPGSGVKVVEVFSNLTIGVLHLQGLTYMPRFADCPFRTAERIVAELKKQTNIICVDFHAEATSEKIAMGWFLDGKVSFVFGTHTHIPTADERILPGGTAYITDIGMTGPFDSVIGRKTHHVMQMILTRMPTKLEVATKDVRLCGAVAEIDSQTAKAQNIKRITIFENGKINYG
jgi:hypothetical protein